MNARGARTRTRLIEATTQVVAQVGYARATTRAIADLAGVAEGTIYRHFADKRELFFAAVLERNAPIVAWLAGVPDMAGRRTVRENMREIFEQLGRLRADLIPLELSLRADPELAGQLREAISARVAPDSDGPATFMRAYVQAEQERGRVRADLDPTTTATILLAALFGIGMLPTGQDEGIDPALLDAAIELLVGGLEPSG